MQTLTITQPDDWHLHVRDEKFLTRTVADSARYFSRAIIMPNLLPPIVEVEQALSYRQRILNHVPDNASFQPLMTLYLTDSISPATIIAAKHSHHIVACKLYPAGATTNSQSGVTRLENIYPVLEAMQEMHLPLLIHGEVTDPTIDVFDRERIFIEKHLQKLCQHFPALPIVLEHLTTQDGVDFIKQVDHPIAATITAHHLLLNRNDLLVGGIKPHYYCLPIVKSHLHQEALRQAATSGNKRFFLGTDSAPHDRTKKEHACGCAGIYTAHAAIELYAEVFAQMNALDKLEAFASFYGADFYGLPRNTNKITLVKKPWQVAQTFSFGDGELIPFRAGEIIQWQVI